MTQIPHISKALQNKHTGESAAIVSGEIVSYGQDSYEAAKNAIALGFPEEEVMTTYIMGKKNYAM